MQYNAIAHVNITPTPKRSEGWVTALAGYSPAVGRRDDQTAEVIITLEAATLPGAAADAYAVLVAVTGQVDRLDVMTTEEFDRRTDAEVEPEYIGATEAAELLGVTRQRIQQMARAGELRSIKVGRALAFTRAELEATAARR